MIQRMIFVGGLLLVALMVAGCIAPMPGMVTADATAMPRPEPVPGQLTVVEVRARPAPMAGGNGAVYLTVLNGLDSDVQLVSASSPAAGVVELHETVLEGDVMRMVHHPEGFPVPAGGRLEMVQGGKHVMLIGVVQAINPGDTVELSLAFDNGEVITLTAPAVEMASPMQGQMSEGMPEAGSEGHGQDAPKEGTGQ